MPTPIEVDEERLERYTSAIWAQHTPSEQAEMSYDAFKSNMREVVESGLNTFAWNREASAAAGRPNRTQIHTY